MLRCETALAALDVRGEIDLVGQLGDVHLEPVLDVVQGLGVGLVRHKGNGQTLQNARQLALSIFFWGGGGRIYLEGSAPKRTWP